MLVGQIKLGTNLNGKLTGGGGYTPTTLIEKTFTENGTYNAIDFDADGFSKVTVNVVAKDIEPHIPKIISINYINESDLNEVITI